METLTIIPARMGSSRFPGKPMAPILGAPMVGHVYKRALLRKQTSDVYVATCDDEIFSYIESIGGNAVMTSLSHERCTDRTTEALLKIEKEVGKKYDIILMVQGDEPMVTPEMMSASINGLIEDPTALVVNLAAKIETEAEFNDPNSIKVVMDNQKNALYFSRSPVPSSAKSDDRNHRYKQVCVISFTREFLIRFTELPPTPLEIIESVDMMRALEHGHKVKMVEHNEVSQAVDTEADLLKVERLMTLDPLISKYIEGLNEKK